MDAQARLNVIAQEITEQGICPELRDGATQLVMGTGNPEADIVFIGEAPGKQEDIHGKPFIGAAGKLLDAMLAESSMNRDDVYITNIVKYRPPNNRDPKQSEKDAFIPYLAQELAIVDPRVVIALGRHSMGYFLPDAVIGDVHGQLFDVDFQGHPITFAPLYHPSAAMYNGSLRPVLFDDFKKVVQAIKKSHN